MGVVPVHPPRVLPGGGVGVIPVDPKGVVPKSTTFRRRSSGRGKSAAAPSPGEKKGNRENEQEHVFVHAGVRRHCARQGPLAAAPQFCRSLRNRKIAMSSVKNRTRSSSSTKCKATQSTRTSSRRRSSVLWQGSARSRQRSQRPDKSRRGGGPVEGRGIGQKPQPLLKRNHRQCTATAAFGTTTREMPGCSIAQMPRCCSRALNAAKRC